MPTTPYTPPPPTTQQSNLSQADYQWLLIVQNLAPLYEVDTSGGSYAEIPPTAGVETSGQTGQCKEITYVKTSSDSNTYTLNGVEGGPYTLTAQYSFLKIKSDGTNWYLAGNTPSGSATPTGPAGGDLSGTYPDPTVAKVNGGAIPLSKTIVGTNGSGEIVDATGATLTNNTSGTAANLSGTPALPNGTTATEQAAGSADAKIATDSYVDRAVATETARAEAAEALLAPLASPALTGSPTAPTQTPGDSSSKISTDAFVAAAVAAGPAFTAAGKGSFWGFFVNHPTAAPASSTMTTVVRAGQFVLDYGITVRKITYDLVTGMTSGVASFGIYDINGNLLIDSGQFVATVANQGIQTVALGAAVTLPPGVYYFGWISNSASVAVETISSFNNATSAAIFNKNVVRLGHSANGYSGTAMPSTLGSLTTDAGDPVPLVLFEA